MNVRITLLTCLVAIPVVYAVYVFFISSDSVNDNGRNETYRVVLADIDQKLTTTGVLQPKMQISVGAQVNGVLNKLHVEEGDYILKGQLLAEIDPTLAQNEVDNAKSELNTALVQKKITSLSLNQSLNNFKRQKKMLAENATTVSDLETAKNKYESDREQLRVNEIQIAQAKVKLEASLTKLQYTRITSPIDGVVLGILTQEGQTIISSQTAPTILVVGNLDLMNVNIRISEMDILKTRIGMPLNFTVTASPEKIYSSTLKNIQQMPSEMLQNLHNNNVDTSNNQKNAVYYNGSFDVINESRNLKPAMSVQVNLVVSEKKQVKVIPSEYLGEKVIKDHYLVDLVHDNKQEKKMVATGIKNPKMVEIISGLEVGDIISRGKG